MRRLHTFLIRSGVMAVMTLGAAAAWGQSRAVGTFDAYQAAHEAAVAELEADATLEYAPNWIIVRFNEGTSAMNREALRFVVGGRALTQFEIVPGAELVEVSIDPAEAVALLSGHPDVDYAEVDWVVRPHRTPNDTYYYLQWGVHNTGQTVNGDPGTADADIDGPEAWDISTGDASFVVAIIDTGTQLNHPDLSANIWVNPGEVAGNGVDDDGNGYVDDVNGWDFYNDDNNPSDSDGHGTHTAGTVGAVGNNGTGVTGVNWACKLAALRFLGPNGGYTSDAVLAVQYCTGKGIKVSNNSWGGGGYSSTLYNAINSSKSVGHVFVAAAGNNGTSQASYPALYDLDNIISVAATDNDDRLASFSNYNSVSVDLGAPGVNIASTYITNSYAYSSGTSMASPHVAGVVALVYAQNPGWTYGQVRQRIFDTVRPVSALAGRTVTGGVVNAAAALAGGGGGNSPPTVAITAPADGTTVNVGTNVTFSGSASDAEDGNISSSIVWTSSLQGQIGTGASFSRSDLVVGTHTITASVTDSGGSPDTDAITLHVQDPNSTPPAAPSGVSASDAGNDSARVTWSDNSNNETYFEIQRQTRVGRTWTGTTIVGSVGANITTFTDPSGPGRFRYRVRAGNSAGVSNWSSWATVRVR